MQLDQLAQRAYTPFKRHDEIKPVFPHYLRSVFNRSRRERSVDTHDQWASVQNSQIARALADIPFVGEVVAEREPDIVQMTAPDLVSGLYGEINLNRIGEVLDAIIRLHVAGAEDEDRAFNDFVRENLAQSSIHQFLSRPPVSERVTDIRAYLSRKALTGVLRPTESQLSNTRIGFKSAYVNDGVKDVSREIFTSNLPLKALVTFVRNGSRNMRALFQKDTLDFVGDGDPLTDIDERLGAAVEILSGNYLRFDSDRGDQVIPSDLSSFIQIIAQANFSDGRSVEEFLRASGSDQETRTFEVRELATLEDEPVLLRETAEIDRAAAAEELERADRDIAVSLCSSDEARNDMIWNVLDHFADWENGNRRAHEWLQERGFAGYGDLMRFVNNIKVLANYAKLNEDSGFFDNGLVELPLAEWTLSADRA